MLWIAVAAQLVAPEPVKFMTWWSADDMPVSVQQAGISRIVLARVTVGPDGSIEDCSAEGDSGDPTLDAITCAIIVKRGKFDPARLPDGSPAYGVFRRPVTWAVGSPPPERDHPVDLDSTLNQMPRGVRSPAHANLVAAVDEGGHPTACSPEPPIPGSQQTTDATLLNLGCDTLMKQWTGRPPLDAQRNPVRSVQTVSVRFSVTR